MATVVTVVEEQIAVVTDIGPQGPAGATSIDALTVTGSGAATLVGGVLNIPTPTPTSLGLVIGTNTQAWSANLDIFATYTPATLPVSTAAQAALDLLVPQTTTVNGHALSGNVTVTAADVGLGNVDNTSDANKPVSTAQAAAIAACADKSLSNLNAWATPPLAPVVMLKTALSSYVAPDIGATTLAHTRNFESSQLLSSGLYSEAAHNVAAYTWDVPTSTIRYKSTDTKSSIFPYLSARDLTQAGWVKTNCTAAKDQVGLKSGANTCSSLTATAGNATCLQSITSASAQRVLYAWVKRLTGFGRVWMTQDNGTHLVDITDQLATDSFTRVSMIATVTNPVAGFVLETNGDAIIVDGIACIASTTPLLPFLSRDDVQVSTLNLGALWPQLTTGKRYMASVQIRVGNSLDAQLVLDDGVGIVHDGIRVVASINGWSIASYSGSAIQYNSTIAGQPSIVNGQDYRLDLIWGGTRISLLQDGKYVGSLDTAGKLDPGTLVRATLTGDGLFSNLKIGELRSHNICLVGDSITASAWYAPLYRNGLSHYDYAVAARGVSGNIITDVTARVATDVTPTFLSRATSNTVVLWIGTNSLAANVSAATALSQLATCISTIKAGAAWTRVVCIDTLKRTGGFSGGADATNFETQRLLYNAGLTAAGADAVITLSTVTEAQDPTNTNWFDSFQIHPNAALNNIFWPIIKATIAPTAPSASNVGAVPSY